MSITPGTYTNPGWVNGGTPALNATNLNNISNAIVKNQTDIVTVDGSVTSLITTVSGVSTIANLGGLFDGKKIHTDTYTVPIPASGFVYGGLGVSNVYTVLGSALIVSAPGSNTDTIQGVGMITSDGTTLMEQAFVASTGVINYYILIQSGTPTVSAGYFIVRYTLNDGS